MRAVQPENRRGDDIQALSDNALMKLLSRGDMGAMEEIYMRYGSMVKSVVYRTIPGVSLADVEDLTQDIFISLMKSADRFDESKPLKPWLYGIAANKAADRRRSDCLHASLLNRHSDLQNPIRHPSDGNVDTSLDLRNRLDLAFSKLSREQHDVMILHAVEGFKGAEIAQILGIEVNTVWVRLHRARKMLSEYLNRESKE